MSEDDLPRSDPVALFAALHEARVDYVLIGAFGAVLHGSPLPTQDVDICPSLEADNLARLAGLLIEALARWETSGTPFASTIEEAERRLKKGNIFSFDTRFGRLDVVKEPAGTRGYADLMRDRMLFEIGEVVVPTASLRAIIRSKQSAGRERDHLQLPTLRKLLDHIEGDPRQD